MQTSGQVSHMQSSGSWAVPQKKPRALVLPQGASGSRKGGSLHRPRALIGPTLPVLAKRGGVSKATVQFNETSINCVQHGMQPQPIVEEERQAGDMQPQAHLEEECHSEKRQPQTPLEEECQAEDMPPQVMFEEARQIEDAMEIKAEGNGERVPAPSANAETSSIIKDWLIQGGRCGEIFVPTVSTIEPMEACMFTQDSLLEIVEARYRESQGATNDSSDEPSLASCSSGGREGQWVRNASWSHSRTMADNGFEPLRRTATPQKLRRGRTIDLEANLSACRKALEQLTLERNKHDQLIAESPDQQVGTHALLEKASSLSARLTDLAAESLECGCNRDVPGAMDVYEQTNAFLDALSDMLQSFAIASMQVEEEEEAVDADWQPQEL